MATAEGSQQIVVFTLGGEEYALPINQVQEIINYQEPRSVSSDAGWIRGVISLRGKIIPVCDLAVRLRLAAAAGDVAGKIVVVEGIGSTAGIVVDEVEEVLTVDEAQIDVLAVAGSDVAHAIAKVEDRLIVLLDSAAVLTVEDVALAA